MKKEFCDRCGSELPVGKERYTISLAESKEPFKTGYLISEDVLCRRCAQGFVIDINGMDGQGE